MITSTLLHPRLSSFGSTSGLIRGSSSPLDAGHTKCHRGSALDFTSKNSTSAPIGSLPPKYGCTRITPARLTPDNFSWPHLIASWCAMLAPALSPARKT
ncbi:hypothetical protein OIU84_023943 [Salix udensis]|uniref:Uncharacterized protein n=1 Tax=Salix udensis TaxID=889485 RepID=A0AAD6J8U1_9ROSI|nr:hypothetical protein OIU84_023943 [Salix udensis]